MREYLTCLHGVSRYKGDFNHCKKCAKPQWEVEQEKESIKRKHKIKEKILFENFPLSHEGCDAFWKYWEENGETHKHGYYESTWGAIRVYLKKAETTKDQRSKK